MLYVSLCSSVSVSVSAVCTSVHCIVDVCASNGKLWFIYSEWKWTWKRFFSWNFVAAQCEHWVGFSMKAPGSDKGTFTAIACTSKRQSALLRKFCGFEQILNESTYKVKMRKINQTDWIQCIKWLQKPVYGVSKVGQELSSGSSLPKLFLSSRSVFTIYAVIFHSKRTNIKNRFVTKITCNFAGMLLHHS